LKTCEDFDLYADGRRIRPQQFDAGAAAIFDLRTTLASGLRDPFPTIDLYLPLAALNATSDELGTARVDELRHTPGTAVLDTTMRGLLLSMQPAQPIALIASHCGFADQSHFTRVFSRGVGMPPAEWRRIRRR
jgi:AraC family transcriptional regulator